MKKYLLTFTALMTASTAYALDCATPPTCAELGYTDTVANCTDAIKCPFDTTLGKCVSSATVGQIGYFPKAPSGNWVLCDGRFLSSAMYPELSTYLGTTFGGTSSSGMFAVPDYRGDFVRVYGSGSGSTTQRQAEGLPNIKGVISAVAQGYTQSGAFSLKSNWSTSIRGGGDSDAWGSVMNFNASHFSPIYGASSYVTPVNTAVYAYIYAGRIDTTAATAKSKLGTSCSKGQYYYTDGTCSSSYSSSKTLKGVVYSTYTSSSSSYSYITYYFGGGSTAYTHQAAVAACRQTTSNASVISPGSVINIIPTGATYTKAYAPVANRVYWAYDYPSLQESTVYTCTSTTSCSTSTDVAYGSSYSAARYYYCSASDYFY